MVLDSDSQQQNSNGPTSIHLMWNYSLISFQLSDHFAWKGQGWMVNILYILTQILTLTDAFQKKKRIDFWIWFSSIICPNWLKFYVGRLKTSSKKRDKDELQNHTFQIFTALHPNCKFTLCWLSCICSVGPPEAQNWSMAAEEELSLLLWRT